jgi:protein-disulfide isomerase
MNEDKGYTRAFMLAMTAATAAATLSVWPAITAMSHPSDEQIREQIKRIVMSAQEDGSPAIADDTASAMKVSRTILKGDANVGVIGSAKGAEVVEFYDYNCGYCRQFTLGVVEPLVQNGSIRVHLVQAPILGPGSRRMALFAAAAQLQGRFEKAHAHLTRQHARTLEEADALRPGLVAAAGLDGSAFTKALRDGSAERVVKANERLSAQAEIRGTPLIYVNGVVSKGAMSIDQMREAIRKGSGSKGA